MRPIVVFFGHGLLHLKDKLSKATVPTGCRLFLCSKHRHELGGFYWMAGIVNAIIIEYDYGHVTTGTTDAVGVLKRENRIHAIKPAGAPVHNYRLSYPEGLEQPEDHYLERGRENGAFTYVTMPYGQEKTLQELMTEYGKPGTDMIWVACRAVEGTPDKERVMVGEGTGEDTKGKHKIMPGPDFFKEKLKHSK